MPGPTHVVDLLKQGITDFHRPNMFEVELLPPETTLVRKFNPITTLTANMIKSIKWPGISIEETQIKRMGFTVVIPTGVTFGANKIEMNLRDDEESKLRQFFLNWQRHHYKDLVSGEFEPNIASLIKGRIHIFQLGSFHQRTTKITMFNVWPSEIGDFDLNHESEDAILDFNVQLSYSYSKDEINKNPSQETP